MTLITSETRLPFRPGLENIYHGTCDVRSDCRVTLLSTLPLSSSVQVHFHNRDENSYRNNNNNSNNNVRAQKTRAPMYDKTTDDDRFFYLYRRRGGCIILFVRAGDGREIIIGKENVVLLLLFRALRVCIPCHSNNIYTYMYLYTCARTRLL